MTILSSDFCFGIIVDYLCLKPIFHIPVEINWQVHKQESKMKRSNQYLNSNFYAMITLNTNFIKYQVPPQTQSLQVKFKLVWNKNILLKLNTLRKFSVSMQVTMFYFWCNFFKIPIMVFKKAILFKEKSKNVIQIFRVVRLLMPKLNYFTRNKSNFYQIG